MWISRFARGVALSLLLSPAFAVAGGHFSSLVIFGDSLSDTGNLAAATGGFPPFPFYLGSRVSDGPVAVEHLAGGLGLDAGPSLHIVPGSPFPFTGDNFAVAGARAGGASPLDLSTQVGAFLLKSTGSAPGDALYVVIIGANDVRDARAEPDKKAARAIVDGAVDAVEDNIRLLAETGARTFVVGNVPDMGSVPETGILAELGGDAKLAKTTTKLSKRFNNGLRKALKRIRKDHDVEIAEFDLFDFLDDVRDHGAELGFDNVDDPCFLQLTVEVPAFNPACIVPPGFPNFAGFVFFDEIHPTGKAHGLAGEALIELVSD